MFARRGGLARAEKTLPAQGLALVDGPGRNGAGPAGDQGAHAIGQVGDTVGSGDAFLAGFVSARFEKLELAECLRQGLAAGAANTQRYGAGVLDLDDARRLLATTEVVELGGEARPRS